ncbi:MAG: tRNA preQ1(34) S-adenosylmethionine ribosyltransferase-isomerase QueA [Firmicutes bacterium]|nr:tRNA preQ1(34) S-adenosylmethionine ribosyltransferase-isomerase QueA [Bacillota bacterium]
MRVEDFDYELPEELIAQEPLPDRDASRLMVLRRATQEIEHCRFYQLPEILAPGDLLVLNDTRVLPARLTGRRATGGAAEILLLHPEGESGRWRALARPFRRLRAGETLSFEGGLVATIVDKAEEGEVVVQLDAPGGWKRALQAAGQVPLPPYIRKTLKDPERYQTVYAREEGSAAAPTAGLHFTPRLLEELGRRGVETACLTLHVGLGTFRPVSAERVEQHRMHAEWYRLPPETAAAVERARARGGRVVAVGTTVCRTLETRATDDGRVEPGSGWTDLFIYPGFRFRAVDALITNFHLPKSTLIMLVSAFAGREFVLEGYRRAVESRYRFYSFGDAMLIL